MTRLIQAEVPVQVDRRGHPLAFSWRRRRYRIARILEVWRDTGTWWDAEGEKEFFRVELAGGGVAELFRDRDGGPWHLYRMWD